MLLFLVKRFGVMILTALVPHFCGVLSDQSLSESGKAGENTSQ